ncbi:alpha/beta fold hydrolase [Amycolatopsis jejuensis]|uniref:alpha/beta fold hydrolase n=1 Tax=Amycolatopsis jejuensis TaxID=330084 RepID=UPI001FE1F1F0|nr:alpha/beta fold hydrolase [Amycolatopsis jejuensis]
MIITSMSRFRQFVPVVVAVMAVPLAPAVASAQSLGWKPCASIAKGWDASDRRTECATVTVPLDYADPGGRTIDLAVSRIRATGERRGAIVVNPGGPGQSGMRTPLNLAESKAAGLLAHHDLIGFDPRGVDYSASIPCDDDAARPDPGLSEKDKARIRAEHKAASNAACFAKDPALVKSFTTPTIARDVDRIREALGEEKIGYYGVSWGTALGAEYRTLFDAHVDKMLLDSVMPPQLSVKTMDDDMAVAGENTFREFAAWIARYDSVYHFGSTEPQVSHALLRLRSELAAHPRPGVDGDVVNQFFAYPRRQWVEAAGQLVAIRNGDTPSPPGGEHRGFGWDTERTGYSTFQQTALLCNESPTPRDFAAVWRDHLDRVKANPVAGKYGSYEQMCVGWPVSATQWQFSAGKSPLQLVGHVYEPVTPISWAIAMQHRIGGSLLTVEDDAHGSLSSLPCAAAAVTFFDTGQPTTQSCPGAPIPAPRP